jgi:hypothetical protein
LSNLVGEMPAGAVDLGGSIQAASAGYSAVDAMAVTIVRLYHEAEELRAEVAMQQQQARILAEERDEARIHSIPLNRGAGHGPGQDD